MSAVNQVDPDEQNETAYEELIVSIQAGEGTLSLLLAVCDDSRLRDEIISRYEAELAPDIRHYPLQIIRGEPSLTQTIRNKVQEDEYLRNGGRAIVTIIGAEQLFFLKLGEDRSEQEVFFGYLQWTREALREFHFPIVLWVTHQLLAQLARHAPDFWSWRKGVFRFASKKTGAVRSSEIEAIRPTFEGFDLPADDDYLLPLEDLKALIAQTEANQPKDSLLAALYSQMGRIYVGRLQRGEAIDYQREVEEAICYFNKAADLQKGLGQEIDLADSLENLALLHKSLGHYSKAEPLYIQVLGLYRQNLGDNHPNFASSLNNLALLYESQGRYGEAETLYVQALEIDKRLLGESHHNVATQLNNLALLYYYQGRYSEAEPLYLQALEIDKRLLGKDRIGVAIDLNNLALLYSDQGRYSEAETMLQQALQLKQHLLGHEHPEVATSLYSLAKLYRIQGRYSAAEPLALQALELDKRLLGEDHPEVASDLNNLALLYESQGNYSQAEQLFQQALDIYERSLGVSHPKTIDVRKSFERLRSTM